MKTGIIRRDTDGKERIWLLCSQKESPKPRVEMKKWRNKVLQWGGPLFIGEIAVLFSPQNIMDFLQQN